MALCYKIHSGRPCCFWAIQIICLSLGQFPILGNSKEQFLKLNWRLIITKSHEDVWTASKSNAMVESKEGVVISTTESKTKSYGTKLIH